MADIFISYSRTDKKLVSKLVPALERHGVSVWWDSDVIVGDRYQELVADEIRNAKAMVLVWSSRSSESEWVMREREMAEKFETAILPVAIDDTPFPEEVMETIQVLDMKQWRGSQDAKPILEIANKVNGIIPRVRINPTLGGIDVAAPVGGTLFGLRLDRFFFGLAAISVFFLMLIDLGAIFQVLSSGNIQPAITTLLQLAAWIGALRVLDNYVDQSKLKRPRIFFTGEFSAKLLISAAISVVVLLFVPLKHAPNFLLFLGMGTLFGLTALVIGRALLSSIKFLLGRV